MREKLLLAATLMLPLSAFAQGTVIFNNRVLSGSGDQAPIVAPIFGVDPACQNCPKTGNPAADWNGTAGPTPVPLGTQVYGGVPLRGTGFTATLWAANINQPDSELTLIAATTFSTRTEQSFAGFIQPPTVPPAVPGVVGGTSDRAKFQVRVWENRGGVITTWAQAIADSTVVHRESEIFTVDAPLGDGNTVPPPTLQNFRSFSLFLPSAVPEPSVLALAVLGILGAPCWHFLTRRH
jgi:hypothetical protein